MKKEIYICDFCKTDNRYIKYYSFSVKRGRVPDPSGNGYMNDFLDIDFCESCLSKKMQILFDEKRLLS